MGGCLSCKAKIQYRKQIMPFGFPSEQIVHFSFTGKQILPFGFEMHLSHQSHNATIRRDVARLLSDYGSVMSHPCLAGCDARIDPMMNGL